MLGPLIILRSCNVAAESIEPIRRPLQSLWGQVRVPLDHRTSLPDLPPSGPTNLNGDSYPVEVRHQTLVTNVRFSASPYHLGEGLSRTLPGIS